jgi:hypothetical protein
VRQRVTPPRPLAQERMPRISGHRPRLNQEERGAAAARPEVEAGTIRAGVRHQRPSAPEKTSDLMVTGTVPEGWRTRPRST